MSQFNQKQPFWIKSAKHLISNEKNKINFSGQPNILKVRKESTHTRIKKIKQIKNKSNFKFMIEKFVKLRTWKQNFFFSNVLVTGGSCKKSPQTINWIPPNGLSFPRIILWSSK